jgi:hypothetical protein
MSDNKFTPYVPGVCRLMQVIETTLDKRGTGRPDDPVRTITQYWTTDGHLLAEIDVSRRA